jgi:hypothetical protein
MYVYNSAKYRFEFLTVAISVSVVYLAFASIAALGPIHMSKVKRHVWFFESND